MMPPEQNPEPSSTPGANPPAPLLIGEVITTSGPRKSAGENGRAQDVELGEDSGGVVFLNGRSAFVWVADGTSETSRRGPFSSRILSQDLGRFFSGKCASLVRQPDDSRNRVQRLADCVTETIETVLQDWEGLLQPDAPLYETLLAELLEIRKRLPEEAPLFHEFSSTFSAGRMDGHGNFQAASIGDSYLILNENSKARFFALERGQITLRLKLAAGRLVFEKHAPPLQLIEAENVRLVLLSSDGARDTIQYLYETFSGEGEFNPGSLQRLKKKIAQINPRTQDDKTLALLARFDDY